MNTATENTTTTSGNGWHEWTRRITVAELSAAVDAATGCGDENCYACDACYDAGDALAAFDNLRAMPRGVVVTVSGGSSPFGVSFPSLTATRFGREVATVSGFWELSEGLSDLLDAVRAAAVTA